MVTQVGFTTALIMLGTYQYRVIYWVSRSCLLCIRQDYPYECHHSEVNSEILGGHLEDVHNEVLQILKESILNKILFTLTTPIPTLSIVNVIIKLNSIDTYSQSEIFKVVLL